MHALTAYSKEKDPRNGRIWVKGPLLSSPMGLRTTPYKPHVALQIEIGQLDSTIAVSNLPLGNMSYWFEGSSIVITMNLTSGMISKPLGIFVNKTSPPTAPPAQLNTQVSIAMTQSVIVCAAHTEFCMVLL